MLAALYFGVVLLSVPASLVFFVLFAISGRKACLIAALLWLLPAPYEILIQTTCTGECNIRIDLLLVLPLELVGLGIASRAGYRAFTDHRRTKADGGA